MTRIKFLISYVISILLLSAAFGQSIEKITFPYTEKYYLQFEGTSVEFDSYNFPQKTKKSGVNYYFFNTDKSNTHKVIFDQYTGTDTIHKEESYVVTTPHGFSWYTTRKDVKKKCEAIKLPLHLGDSWDTYYGPLKMKAKCITLDTLISTPAGDFHAFGIEFLCKVKDDKQFSTFIVIREYYDPAVGKIAIMDKQYTYIKEQDRTMKHNEQVLLLKSYGMQK